MHKSAAVICVLLLCAPAVAAAKVMDAKSVTAFLAACAKDQDACNTEISDQVNAEADDQASHAVCLSDDQRDEPITISRAMLRWLRATKEVAAKPPAEAVGAGAKILYPCDP